MSNGKAEQIDQLILNSITRIISNLEEADMIVCISDLTIVGRRFAAELLEKAPQLTVTSEELSGLRSLAYHAINDKNFFDWEMPTLTGYTVDGFEKIIEKLPNV